jgi:hypothetical protein
LLHFNGKELVIIMLIRQEHGGNPNLVAPAKYRIMLLFMGPLMVNWSSIVFSKDLADHVLPISYFRIYILKVSYKVNRKNLTFVFDGQIMKSLFKNEVLIQFLECYGSSIS